MVDNKTHLLDSETIESLYNILHNYYGPQGWWPLRSRRIRVGAEPGKTIGFNSGGYHPGSFPPITSDEVFEIAAGAVLTQNTSWNNAASALDNLISAGLLSPDRLNKLSREQLAELIRPCGYYNQKSERLKGLAEAFCRGISEDGKVRSAVFTRSRLLEMKGIGPETADSILLYAFDKPYFVIDAYTRRILSRITGNADIENADYEKMRICIQKVFQTNIIKMQEFHALFVIHAKKFCLKKEKCSGCPAAGFCDRMAKQVKV